jgi:hypothetical protein
MARAATPGGSANQIIHDFINRMARQRFFGTISVRFEDGVAVHIRREESLPVGKVGAGYEGVSDE